MLKAYFNNDELAMSVWQGKYSDKADVTPKDMHERMAREFARVTKLSYDEIMVMFDHFKYIIPQGSIMATLGKNYKIASLSNCFVVGQPHDSYSGIMRKDEELVQLMKRRGGVGIDISTLRPANSPVTNAAGSSTGAVSFMDRYSNSTREVAQNGRRGALMISIDVRHPDVEHFINIKKDLTKVTGANISVMLRDDFMKAVTNNEDYVLRWPCDYDNDEVLKNASDNYEQFNVDNITVYTKKVNAKAIYDQIIQAAWASAEPGIIFIDKHWDYSPDTVYPEYKGITTNPCGEIFMGKYDACRLIALNLYSFVNNPFTKDARIDYQKLYEMSYNQQVLADGVIDLEVEHINRILDKIDNDRANCDDPSIYNTEYSLWENIRYITKSGRRTGCGFTGLGDMLAALRIKYDSNEALSIIEEVMKTKFKAELNASINMAEQYGAFIGFDANAEFDIVRDNKDKITSIKGKNQFYQMLVDNFYPEVLRMIEQGRRNVSFSTVAPTGSVSILTQTTSGLEPLFNWGYMRRKKVNPGDSGVRVDFTDQNGDTWMEYPVVHPKFINWYSVFTSTPYDTACEIIQAMSNDEIQSLFALSPWYESTANDIDWTKRVEIQGIIQKYTTHSISSTINLPNEVTVDEVATIYTESWKKGLKGTTIYRDGCRTGVLVQIDAKKADVFEYRDAPKRPEELHVDIYHIKAKAEPYTILVGLLDRKPYEVFCIPNILCSGYKTGFLKKKSRGVYNLTCTLDNEFSIVNDITKSMSDEQQAITRLISTSLRHGADIKFIVEQLLKTDGELNSFTKAIARTLKQYIPDGTTSTATCLDCGSKAIVYEEGCQKCKECGSSKCG